jgi:uncharacterized membrane protein YphA (DoxX/SURF4 family)
MTGVNMERFLGRFSLYLYAIMRIVVGFLFMGHGAQKLFGVFGGMTGAGDAGASIVLLGGHKAVRHSLRPASRSARRPIGEATA